MLKVDCNFPGGNILVDHIVGDFVYLHQDLRDTKGDWFYWYFRVTGAGGKTVNFYFTKSAAIGALGPAYSLDEGKTWEWLGEEAVRENSFVFSFPENAKTVRFCMAIPYLEENFKQFLKKHKEIKKETLCISRKGRKVELLRLGNPEGKYKVLLTCRHHCCEMTAGYALEGIMGEILRNKELYGKADFLIVPFVDKDGVEDGDQGKNRKPYDHNRDYGKKSIYPEVRALKKLVGKWLNNKTFFAMDLHCPWLKSGMNEQVYFVGQRSGKNWKQTLNYSRILEKTNKGQVVYFAKDNLPYGVGWNTGISANFSRWAASLPKAVFAATVEIPYARAHGKEITPAQAREFGEYIAKAILVFLRIHTDIK